MSFNILDGWAFITDFSNTGEIVGPLREIGGKPACDRQVVGDVPSPMSCFLLLSALSLLGYGGPAPRRGPRTLHTMARKRILSIVAASDSRID